VPQRPLPDQRDVGIRGARDLDGVQGRASCEDAAEDLVDLGFASAGVEHRDARRRDRRRRHQEPEGIERGIRRHEAGRRGCQTAWHRDAGERQRLGSEAFAGHGVQQTPLERRPQHVRQLGPAVLRLNGTQASANLEPAGLDVHEVVVADGGRQSVLEVDAAAATSAVFSAIRVHTGQSVSPPCFRRPTAARRCRGTSNEGQPDC